MDMDKWLMEASSWEETDWGGCEKKSETEKSGLNLNIQKTKTQT